MSLLADAPVEIPSEAAATRGAAASVERRHRQPRPLDRERAQPRGLTRGAVSITDIITIGAGTRNGHQQGVIRHHGRPVGPITWSPTQTVVETLDQACSLARIRESTPLARPAEMSVSLVIPTCGRPELLARCLESVLALDAPGLDVVIVDNRPSDPSGRRVFDLLAPHVPGSMRVRYFAEPIPGASRARNLGWRASSGDVVAFCDDDCVVDRYWIEGLRRAFHDDVDAVTGQVLPLEQATIAQVHFEQYGGFGRGPHPCRFDLGQHRPSSPFFPYTAGRFGSGNNAAFRRRTLEAVGGFSESLGPGTPAHAGEDLDMFVSVVRRGGVLAYEPSALVWHRHRPEASELTRQLHCYGVGLSAMITKQALSSRSACREIVRLILPGSKLLLSPSSSKNIGRTGGYPRGLVRAELRGIAVGPIRFGAARRRARKIDTPRRRLQSVVRILRPAATDALYRNALALACNSVGTAVLGLLYWAVAARLYPATEVGRASALISAMTLCSGIAQLNLLQGLPRFIPVAGASTAQFVRRAYAASLSVAVVVAGLALLGATRGWWGATYLQGSTAMSIWFVVAVAAWTLFTLQDAVLIGLGQSIWVPIENVTFSVVKIVVLIVGAHLFQRHGVFLSFTVPVALTLVPVNLMLFKRLVPRHQRAATGPRFDLSWRSLGSHLALDFLGSLAYLGSVTGLPLIVATRAGLADTAYFATTWMIVMSADLVLSGFTASLIVEGAANPDRLGVYVGRLLRLAGIVILPGLVIVGVGAPLVLRAMGAAYATEATTLLRLLAAAMGLRIITMVCFACWRVRRQARRVLVVQWALAASILTMSWELVGRYGITGVGLAFLIPQAAAAIVCLPTLVGTVAARTHRRTLPRWLPEVVLGAAAASAGLGAVRTFDADGVGDAGLIQAVGPLWLIAIVLFVAAFVTALRHERPPASVMAGLTVLGVLLLHGFGPATETHPRFFSAYLHTGFIEAVERTGHFLPGLDARFSWPSTFSAAAFVSAAGGEALAVWMMRWAPVVFMLAYLPPIWMIARSAGGSIRHRWITLALFIVLNWYGQDYLSPQAFGLFCYLAVIGIALDPFGTRRVVAWMPTSLARQPLLSFHALWRRDHVSHAPTPAPPLAVQRGLFAVALGLIAIVTVSHQLTPVMLVAALIVLSITGRTRLRLLWIFALVAMATWFSFGATAFWSGHLGMVTGGVGKLSSNVSSGLTERAAAVSSARQAMLLVRVALTAIGFGLAAIGVARRWRSGWFSMTSIALAVMPFFLLALQSYGGEALIRAGVFSAPFVAVNAAFAFCGTTPRVRRRPVLIRLRRAWRSRSSQIWRAISIGVGVALCAALVTARFGNESFEAVTDPDAAAMQWVYANAPLGSTLLSVSRNLPWRYQQLEGYVYHPSGDDVFGNFDQLNGVLGPIYELDHDAFVIVSPTQSAFAIALYGAKPGWLDNLIEQIERCRPFALVHRDGASRIYRVRAGANLTACAK